MGRSRILKDYWAKTYVLDSAFDYFVKKNMNILPDWFTEVLVDDYYFPVAILPSVPSDISIQINWDFEIIM